MSLSLTTGDVVDFSAVLLDTLGFTGDEFVSLGYEDTDGVFHTAVMAPADTAGYIDQIPTTANIYFGVCAVAGPARTNFGRGKEADVTRLAALWADLDAKEGACGSLDVADAIIATLSIILGTRPSVIVDSGYGRHPYWPISDGHIGDVTAARALLKRWHRLVTHVAETLNVAIDNVYDLPRMLRLPGSHNNKNVNGKGAPLVIAHAEGGGPLTMAEAAERFTEYGIFETDDDRVTAREEVSSPAEWKFAETSSCAYVTAIIAGFPADGPKPGGGRNPWLCSQEVRLACAWRLGCITEADYQRGRETLARRHTEILHTTDPRRQVKKFEFRDAHKLGIKRASEKTVEEAQQELGGWSGHTHAPGNGPAAEGKPAQQDTEVPPVSLDEAHTVFTKWFGDDYDTDALDAELAAVAVERFDDGSDPVWLLLVSGPGAAKTETAQALDGVNTTTSPALVVSCISSEAALLSGTSKRDRAKAATGGLLRRIGGRGVLVIKDVTTILAMDRNTRGNVLAALREIYDGRWSREVGTDGGRFIEWRGRIVVVGAVTTAWDTAHAVVATMGDRFVLIRIDSTTYRQAAGRKAIGNTGDELVMRAELAAAAAGVIAGMDTEPEPVTDAETDVLLAAADLVTLARTGVEYDYHGDVIDAHAPEMPTRFAKQLAQIVRGGVAIGMTRGDALRLAMRCARDSMPPLRLAIIDDLALNPASTAPAVARRINKPRSTVKRQLQALQMLGVANATGDDDDEEQDRRHRKPVYHTLARDIDPAVIQNA
jgi:hypothetical protein